MKKWLVLVAAVVIIGAVLIYGAVEISSTERFLAETDAFIEQYEGVSE